MEANRNTLDGLSDRNLGLGSFARDPYSVCMPDSCDTLNLLPSNHLTKILKNSDRIEISFVQNFVPELAEETSGRIQTIFPRKTLNTRRSLLPLRNRSPIVIVLELVLVLEIRSES
jgi:hypothetical protein